MRFTVLWRVVELQGCSHTFVIEDAQLSLAIESSKKWGTLIDFYPSSAQNWRSPGPPGPLGDYTPELDHEWKIGVEYNKDG